MTRAAVGLGSNVEHRLTHLRGAVKGIAPLGQLVKVSALYETAPLGGPPQEPYLNAVVVLDTPLRAAELLDRLQAIERDFGRTRQVHWGPRTLDLDLLVFGEETHDTPELILPHPRIGERRFVLEPLTETWPEASLSGGGPAELAESVSHQQVKLVARDWVDDGIRLADQGTIWVAAQGALLLSWLVVMVITGSWPDWARARPWLGLVCLGAGSWWVASSVRTLGTSLTALPAPAAGAALVDRGPYGVVRHPIYSGLLVVMLGAGVLVGAWPALVITLILLGFFAAKSISEERRLRLVYPGYAEYQSRVRHRLLPGLW
jgi:2-amino-4-hydroxy-6-hydroxymethyldihydropteridine diphosphokinase